MSEQLILRTEIAILLGIVLLLIFTVFKSHKKPKASLKEYLEKRQIKNDDKIRKEIVKKIKKRSKEGFNYLEASEYEISDNIKNYFENQGCTITGNVMK